MKKREKTREKVKVHPTNTQVERIKKDIRSLMNIGKSDIEIRETLGLELRTYQKYAHILHLEDQKLWLSITQEQLASELLRLRSCLNDAYKISKQLSEDSKLPCQDRLTALQSMLDSRLSLVQILREYDEFKRKIPTSQPEEQESDIPITLKRVHS